MFKGWCVGNKLEKTWGGSRKTTLEVRAEVWARKNNSLGNGVAVEFVRTALIWDLFWRYHIKDVLLWGTGKREEARIKARLYHEYQGRAGANCWNKEHRGRSRLRKQRSSDQLWWVKSEPSGAMTTQVWSSSVEFWLEREWGETWELKCICSQTQTWMRSPMRDYG